MRAPGVTGALTGLSVMILFWLWNCFVL